MNSKIEPYHETAAQIVSERLLGKDLKELKEMGYDGIWSILYTYFGKTKFEERVKRKVSQRVETSMESNGRLRLSPYFTGPVMPPFAFKCP